MESEEGAEVELAQEGAGGGAEPEWMVEGGRCGVLLLLLLMAEEQGADDVAAEVEQEVHPGEIDRAADEVAQCGRPGFLPRVNERDLVYNSLGGREEEEGG